MSDLLSVLTESLAGEYAVERELGRGGMATVFLAQDVKHGRKVAIKVLHPELASSMGAERFQREIGIAAQLQHPNILPLYDSGIAREFLYYVMPYVEGESLRDRMDREKQLGLDDAIKITVEVAGALSYAHSRGFVHRDIKPENILLSGGVAVVADFGIARAVSAVTDQSLTQTGTVVGTPAYMSPEQASGSQDIDGRGDQYSLACVLYEMLVGAQPFTGPTAMAVMARHSMDAVSPPSIVRDTIPDSVEDALLKAMNKVPADRFATCQQFAEALVVPSAATGQQRRLTAATMRRQGDSGSRVTMRPSVTLELPVPGWPTTLKWGIPVVLLLLVGWATRGQWLARDKTGAGGGLDPRHVAVRYFEDLSPGKQLGYLADGLTEGLIDQLSPVQGLTVISSNGVAPYRDPDVPRDSIARALGVGSLIEGAVEPAGNRVRVTVRLVDGPSGADLDRKTYEVATASAATVRDSLTQEVSRMLRGRLGEEIRLRERRAGTTNVDAWVRLQRAERLRKDAEAALAAADTGTAGRDLAAADSLFAGAAALDARWAWPWVERGWTAYQQLDLASGFDQAFYERWLVVGLSHAERALALDGSDADALELRGTLRYYQWILNLAPTQAAADTLLAAAEADLEGSVAANPQQAGAWALLSHMYMRLSRTAEGKLAALRAYEADPYLAQAASVLWRLYQASLDLEDGVEAAKWCAEGGRRFPAERNFVECQITVNALPGARPDVPRMWQLLEENVDLYPPNQREYRRRRGELLVAMTLVRAGLPDSARRVALRARGETPDPTTDLVYIEAMLRNMLGDRDEALRLVGLHLAANPQDRATMARDYTWWWAGIRDDPRFKTLVGAPR